MNEFAEDSKTSNSLVLAQAVAYHDSCVNIAEAEGIGTGNCFENRSRLVFAKHASKWKSKVQTAFWSSRLHPFQSDRGLACGVTGCGSCFSEYAT